MRVIKKPLGKHHGAIKPLERKPRPLRLVGFDSEDNTKGLPLSFAFHDGERPFYTTSADEAIRFIYASPETTVFVAHNLEYDIGNLFKGSNFIYLETVTENHKWLRCNLKGTLNYFINSNAFFMGSLRSMGELIGYKKLKGDVLNPRYVCRDAEIAQRFTQKFQERVNSAFGVSLGITIGQMSMAIYRRRFLPGPQVTWNSPLCLDAYYGGRVEIYRAGVLQGPVHVSDIASSYPHVMSKYDYPDTGTIERSTLASHRFGVGTFTVFIPRDTLVPPLPFRSPGRRLFFPVGEVTGTWTYAEMEYAIHKVPGFKIIKEFRNGEGTNVPASPFSAFVAEFYQLRKTAKDVLKVRPHDQAAQFEVVLLKLLMNNLYGKMAAHLGKRSLTRTRLTEGQRAKDRLGQEQYIPPFWAYRGPDEASRTSNYMWGAHVTSYARIELMDKMWAVVEDGGSLAYCDTDSVMYTGPKCKSLSYGSELGQVDYERFALGIFQQAKGYLLCRRTRQNLYTIVKVACKGVPKYAAREFVVTGMASYLKPFRLKEALIRMSAGPRQARGVDAEVGINVWHQATRNMRSAYIKRYVLPGGKTRGVTCAEIPLLEEGVIAPIRSVQVDLDAMGISLRSANKYRHTEFFSVTTVPDGWFKDTGLPPGQRPSRVHYLRKSELEGLAPGSLWFSGFVESLEDSQWGKWLKVDVKQYMGQCMTDTFKASFPVRFLPNFDEASECMTRKYLEIWLERTYIKGADLSLKVCVSGANPGNAAFPPGSSQNPTAGNETSGRKGTQKCPKTKAKPRMKSRAA